MDLSFVLVIMFQDEAKKFRQTLADQFEQLATIEIGTTADTKATGKPWLFLWRKSFGMTNEAINLLE